MHWAAVAEALGGGAVIATVAHFAIQFDAFSAHSGDRDDEGSRFDLRQLVAGSLVVIWILGSILVATLMRSS